MKKAEIKRIANFIKDLEGPPNEQDYSHVTLQERLQELYPIIKSFMDETFKADQDLKPVLALFEYRARKCRECIERRMATRN